MEIIQGIVEKKSKFKLQIGLIKQTKFNRSIREKTLTNVEPKIPITKEYLLCCLSYIKSRIRGKLNRKISS